MANKNKKITELAQTLDEDPTGKFPIPAEHVIEQDDAFEPEIELDARTYDIEDHNTEFEGKSRSELKVKISDQSAAISELHFDIEQLRNRQRGLQEEIKAREEINDNLIAEVRDARKDIESLNQTIAKRGDEVQKLQALLETQQARADREKSKAASLKDAAKDADKQKLALENKLSAQEKTVAKLKRRIETEKSVARDSAKKDSKHKRELKALEARVLARESRIADLSTYIDGRQVEWTQIQASNESLQQQLDNVQSAKASLTQEIADRSEQLDRAHQKYLTTAEQLKQQKSTARNLKTKNEELEKALHNEAAADISRYKSQLAATSGELLAKTQAFDKLKKNAAETERYADSLREQLQDTQSRKDEFHESRAKLEKELETALTDLKKAQDDVRELKQDRDSLQKDRAEVESARERELKEADAALADQRDLLEKEWAGKEAALRAEMQDLDAAITKQRETFEQAAANASARHEEALQSLQDKFAEERESLQREQTDLMAENEEALEKARAELADERETLEQERARIESEHETLVSELNNKIAEQREQLEAEKSKSEAALNEEIRKVRFELSGAQDTLAGQESMNGELSTKLLSQQTRQQSLEDKLSVLEKESEQTIQELGDEIQRLKKKVKSSKRKLDIKDGAISDLMKELSGQGGNIEFGGNADNVLQGIDGFRDDDSGSHPVVKDRERTTRLLIGNADGRELRFPLFKDRLSIGRTTHNDIQLNMQFVSRRHAVIATDDNKTRVIDWGSKNGVFVNDRRVTERILQSGDVVTIGTTDFRYEERQKR